MARNRGGHAKVRRSAVATAIPSQNGSSNGSAPQVTAAPQVDRVATEHMERVLLHRNLLTQDQIDEVLAVDPVGADFGNLLVSLGLLAEHDLTDVRAEITGLPVIDLRQVDPEPEALALIPDALAREHLVIPIALDEVGLHVAMADQPSPELGLLLAETSGTAIRPMLAPLSEIRHAIENNYRAIRGLDHLVQVFEAVEVTRKRNVDTTSVTPEAVVDDAPVVQVVGRILTQAMRDRASDIHIEPSEQGIRVRYRIDGALKEVLTLPSSMGVGLISRIKIMAGMNIVERRRPQDGQLRTEIDGKDVDVRVATVATIWGEKCVMRVLDRTRSVLHLSELGMPTEATETYSELRPRPVRHGPVCRADRQWQDDHFVRNPFGDRRQHPQRDDDRGPGRVRLSLY